MCTHGTDQDMVQRMLTASDIRRSRRSLILSGLADIPIAFTFLSIGILLWVYYQAYPDPTLSNTPNETFCHFILYQMPVGLRGLLIAGIFATAMGSLSTALNALATSFTCDWYQPYISPGATEAESLRAVRWATVGFAILMIVVASATSYCVIVLPNVRIIPIALGIFGYTYGSLLGIFFCGMLTRTRGRDAINPIAMIAGFLFVALISNLPNDIAHISAPGFTRRQPGSRSWNSRGGSASGRLLLFWWQSCSGRARRSSPSTAMALPLRRVRFVHPFVGRAILAAPRALLGGGQNGRPTRLSWVRGLL